MLCNWCHEVIPEGEELREQGSGYSYSVEGTGEGRYVEGGYYHRECYYKYLEYLKQKRWWRNFWIAVIFMALFFAIMIWCKN